MKRFLSLALSVLLIVGLVGGMLVSADEAAPKGYKVYPFCLFTNPNSSATLKMTPDGGYSLTRNPAHNGDCANLSFLVTNIPGSIDYESMHYLYLKNVETNAPLFVKAAFVDSVSFVADTWSGTMVYSHNAPPSGTTIQVDLKQAMGDAWTPAGKILCLQLWLQHDRDDSKKMELDSIWLGADQADLTEHSKVNAASVGPYSCQSGTLTADEAHPDGGIFQQTDAGADVWKYYDVNVSETPYVYVHVTGYSKEGEAALLGFYIAPDADYANGVGGGGRPVLLRTDSLQGDSEFWLRFDLRDYFPADKLANGTVNTLFSFQPGIAPATMKFGGIYVGGQTFAATETEPDESNPPTEPSTNPDAPKVKGFKVYPFEAFVTASGKLDMTPDGAYTLSSSAAVNDTYGFLSFLVSNTGNVNYNAQDYLYLYTGDSIMDFTVKAEFHNSLDGYFYPGVMVYTSGAETKTGSVIQIPYKQILQEAGKWDPNGKYLGISILFNHGGDASKTLKFKYIWLGSENISTEENGAFDAAAFDFSDPTFIGNASSTAVTDVNGNKAYSLKKDVLAQEGYVVKDLPQGSRIDTPYVYINVSQTPALVTSYFYMKDPDNILTRVRVRPEMAGSNVWIRLDLRDYANGEATLKSETLTLRSHNSFVSAADASADPVVFGVYYGDELFRAGSAETGDPVPLAVIALAAVLSAAAFVTVLYKKAKLTAN